MPKEAAEEAAPKEPREPSPADALHPSDDDVEASPAAPLHPDS